MNNGGDAAEQVVRMSLEGVEVIAKITGEGAKNLAIMIAAILKEEQKTKGKARLTNLLKSGKELNVFSIQSKDLKKFSQEAKRYGVLYTVVKSKNNNSCIDVIARAEDAPKINRIVENFKLATIDTTELVKKVEKTVEERTTKKSETDQILDDILGKKKEEGKQQNPDGAKTEKSPRSEQGLTKKINSKEGSTKKESVRKKINGYKNQQQKRKEVDKDLAREKQTTKTNKNRQTIHKQPRRKRKVKER